jgi:hypothetical protein
MLICRPSYAQTLDPNKPPGGNFNLTNFYLGLPVDSSGGTSGDSASIPAAQLVAGYSNALYFYTGPDGAMVFWAPVTGATTSGSSYPRSELREQVNPPSNSSNWFAFGTHTLDAQCRVQQVPSSGKVIIGQIHGYTGAALPLVKLQYNSGNVEVLIKTNANNDLTDYKYTYGAVGLSNNITYQIKVLNGLVVVTVNGITRSLNVFQSDPDWATNTLYYKAGSYCQDNTGTTNEGARVAFYAVSRAHAPAVTNTPFALTVPAGTNATFSVNAFGNGPLGYQWLLNLTNSLPRATNASLTLTNVQTTNAGAYYVRVTDAFGSVTNQIATLTVNRPPVPGPVSTVTGQAIPVTTSAASLISAGSDPDGDYLTVPSVDALSANGGSVSFSNGVTLYQPLPGFVGADSWSYILADTRGAASTGVVIVTVVASNAITLISLAQRMSSNSGFTADFLGVPGLSYSADRATSPVGPWELAITNVPADTNGFFSILDPNPDLAPQRFYRVRYP